MSLNVIEKEVIDSYKKKLDLELDKSLSKKNLSKFFLILSMRIAKLVREKRSKIGGKSFQVKKDGSPVTEFENEIESFIKNELKINFPQIQFLGEELGGEVPETGMGISVDPIDGTWSFLSQNNTVSTSIALFENKTPIIGIILNPATAELGYCYRGEKSRIIQFDLFGEGDIAYDLPNHSDNDNLLVNFHPSTSGIQEIEKLYEFWNSKKIQMVKSPGGSPAWAILEAAKGDFTYINKWDKSPSKSYDLAAAKLIIEGAGGKILNNDLETIPHMGHQGMFIAGTDMKKIQNISELLKEY